MKKFIRRDYLIEIEKKLQDKWYNKNLFTPTIPKQENNTTYNKKDKFLVTIPYPYMNGRLHLGHAFSISKAEFQSRYQRLIGKNVLFPFGFHCTGMPISAAAQKIENEIKISNSKDNKENKPQTQILRSLGITDEEIPKFANPNYWLEYFPKLAIEDLKSIGFGIDFTRSFITTERNKYYDKFVRWQFNKLLENNKIKFGKKHTIYSVKDQQPCSDHDRSVGEGVNPQEYSLIKFKLIFQNEIKYNNKLETYRDKNVYILAATLRPETVYGITNCYIKPDGEYFMFKHNKEGTDKDKNIDNKKGINNKESKETTNDSNDIFICSELSGLNLQYQV